MVKSTARTLKHYSPIFGKADQQPNYQNGLVEAAQTERPSLEKLSCGTTSSSEAKSKKQWYQSSAFRKFQLICSVALPFFTNSTAFGQTPTPFLTSKTLGTPRNTTVVASGGGDAADYLQLAQNYSLAAGMEYRYGTPSTVSDNGFPTLYQPSSRRFDNHGNGSGWDYQIGSQDISKNDYMSNHAQLLFVPDAMTHPGLAVVQTMVMAEGTVSIKPELPWVYYGGGNPIIDLVTRLNYVLTNGGPLRQPTAVAHSYGQDTWSTNSLVTFQSGLVAAFGSNTGPGNVAVKLAPGKVPTAIAITPNNEFALVTVWDTNQRKGQVAVLALGTGNSFWGDWSENYPGFRNKGLFTFMKILGYIDLPGMTQPTEICTATDYTASSDDNDSWLVSADGRDRRYEARELPFSNEANRVSFISGGNRGRYSRSGYATIISKAEKKVIFLDLKPLFSQMYNMYLTSRSNFLLTQNTGMLPNQWPYSFDNSPSSAPTVAKVVDMAQAPTAVRTNIVPGYNQAYVATQDGTLHLFSVGGYSTTNGGTPADIREVGSVAVGSNPTSIAYSKNKGYNNDANTSNIGKELIVCSRGERAIKWVQLSGNSATVTKTLRDTRMKDPVWVEDNDNHGSEVPLVSVTDYTGKQLLSYRYGNIIFHTNGGNTYGIGGNGQFECGGAYQIQGRPFQVSGSNVP